MIFKKLSIIFYILLLFRLAFPATSKILLLNPNGGENWAAGKYQTFHWRSDSSVQFVKLEYSLDAGTTWFLIEDGIPNHGKYNWKVASEITNQGLIRISDSNDKTVFDITDGFFTIFELNPPIVNTVIPKPVTLTIDDVGWQRGTDDSPNNGPFRLGINRDPVLADYEVLVYVAQKIGVRLSANFILSEFDRENILANYPTTNEFGENWDNSRNVGPHNFEIMDFIKENSAWLELGLHGVRHEYWDWNNKNGAMVRTEFHNEIEDQPWPFEILIGHLQAFQEILNQYGIFSFPKSFVTTGNGYYYHDQFGTGKLLKIFGVKYALSDIVRTGNYSVPAAIIQAGGTIDSGVLWIQQARETTSWPVWNAVAAPPSEYLNEEIAITHWPNWMAGNPDENLQVGDLFINWFNQVKTNPDWYVPKNNAQFYSQWLYRKFSRGKLVGNKIVIDNSSMPNEAYDNDLLGNLVLKTPLKDGKHISAASISSGAEIVGYWEEFGFAYVVTSRLEQKTYEITYEIGSAEIPSVDLLDGTYNLLSVQSSLDQVILNLELFGKYEIQIPIPFEPSKLESDNSKIIIQSTSYNPDNKTLSLNIQSEDIFGQRGNVFINSSITNVKQTLQPQSPVLFQNYPNPFNSSTQIDYYLPKESKVVITIFSISGKKVKELLNSSQNSGFHTITWDGKNSSGEKVNSGVFYMRMRTNDFSKNSKVVLLN